MVVPGQVPVVSPEIAARYPIPPGFPEMVQARRASAHNGLGGALRDAGDRRVGALPGSACRKRPTMASPSSCPTSPAPEQRPTERTELICPACGGQLLLLHSLWRCPRCRYSICDGCEGGAQDSGSQ